MTVPLNWLKDYTDVTLPPAELAQKLTMAGFEVAEIITTGGGWENIVIGQITAVNPHPNADRLHLATVDLGGEQETVVCGAPNLKVGDKIAFARAGARLVNPYNGKVEELKPAKIRGVVSKGMICSEKELGISESHEGIMVLGAEAKTGTALAELPGKHGAGHRRDRQPAGLPLRGGHRQGGRRADRPENAHPGSKIRRNGRAH